MDPSPARQRRRKKTPYQRELRGLGHGTLQLPGQGRAPSPKAASPASPESTPWPSSTQGWSNAGAEEVSASLLHRPLSTQKPEERGCDSKQQVLARILSLARDREVELSSLLSKERVSAGDLEKVWQQRAGLLGYYERVILSDVALSEAQNVSQALWKNAFHQVIERLGQLLRHPSTLKPEHVHSRLSAVLDEGTAFFRSLLEKLERRYRFQLADHTDGLTLCKEPSEGPLKCALACSQKSMICLGDIARYREQSRGTANFGQARSWYLKAQRLDPSDGRPFDQLALLAVYTKRKLEAVCYFMRSLAAASPGVCSQKNLTKLFEATKRKAEERVQLAPSGALGAGDLQQSFLRSFLQAHGQLFTGIGMETFPAVADEVLETFELLLQRSPAAVGNQQMLCLVTINIFTVHHSQRKETSSEPRCPSMRAGATALGLAMFGLLARCCTYWLHRCPRAPVAPAGAEGEPRQIMVSSFSPALKALLPSVKICSEWMLISKTAWNPPATTPKPYPEASRDVWGTLERLHQALMGVNTSEVPLYTKPGKDLTRLILEEDRLFSGFAPLRTAARTPCYLKTNSEEVVAGDCRRVNVLKDLLEALCRQEKPFLEAQDGPCKGVAPTADSLKKEMQRQQQRRPERQEGGKEFPGDLLVEGEGVPGYDSRELEAKKQVLAEKIAEEQHRQEKIKAILEAATRDRQKEEEVRARFLVPDTNCFIQHLGSLSKLLKARKHVLLVPLIVIHELNGLAKGQQGDPEAGAHSSELQQEAQKSLDFLQRQLKLTNPQLKVLGSHGEELETTDYDKRDIVSQQGNNDDRILACCLNYRRAQAESSLPGRKNEQMQLRPRGLLLLTDDRTLRVKALASNVPVWDNETFLREVKRLRRCPPPCPPLARRQQTQNRSRPAVAL